MPTPYVFDFIGNVANTISFFQVRALTKQWRGILSEENHNENDINGPLGGNGTLVEVERPGSGSKNTAVENLNGLAVRRSYKLYSRYKQMQMEPGRLKDYEPLLFPTELRIHCRQTLRTS